MVGGPKGGWWAERRGGEVVTTNSQPQIPHEQIARLVTPVRNPGMSKYLVPDAHPRVFVALYFMCVFCFVFCSHAVTGAKSFG